MSEIKDGQPSAAAIQEYIDLDEVLTALNTAHRGPDETVTALNTTHRSSDGKNHSDVVSNTSGISTNVTAIGLNTTHRGSDGSDHSKVGANETAIGLNTTHRGSDGKNHSDVGLNNSHRVLSPEHSVESEISFVIDGGGNAITTGIKGDLEVPFACVIQSVTLLADQTGSITIDIWKDTYANFPPDNADTITGGNEPAISAAVKDQDATLTSWTTSLAKGDVLRFNVDSVATIQRVTLSLKVNKS